MVLLRDNTGGKLGRLLRGHWDHFQHVPGKHTAAIACPYCDRLFSIVKHTIARDGSVAPSVVCPRSDCIFHEYVKLDGWAEIAL